MVPPGYPPAMAGANVQVFGAPDSQATRAAHRFFRERRVEVHLVDVTRKPMTPTELRRFMDRLGVRAVADPESRALSPVRRHLLVASVTLHVAFQATTCAVETLVGAGSS